MVLNRPDQAGPPQPGQNPARPPNMAPASTTTPWTPARQPFNRAPPPAPASPRVNANANEPAPLPGPSAPPPSVTGLGPIPSGRGNVGPQNAANLAQPVVGEIEGAAMAGFNDLAGILSISAQGFLDMGAKVQGLQVTNGPNPVKTALGLDVSPLGNEVGNAAAYVVPGGAILHGIGDVNEGVDARVFDVGVGSLFFIPGIGEVGEGLGVAGRAGIGAASGAAISGIGTALRGGTPLQDLEAATIGAGIGAVGGAAIGKLGDWLSARGTSEVAPAVTTIGTTEEGEPVLGDIHGFPGSEIHGGPAGLGAQVGPGDVVPSGEGFSRVRLTQSGFDLSETEGSIPTRGAGFLESGARIVNDPLKGETYMEGGPPEPSTSALAGRSPPPASEPWDMPGYRGGALPGETRSPFKLPDIYQNEPNPSVDTSLSGPTGESGVPAGNGASLDFQAKTDYMGNPQGTPWEEARFRSIYASRNFTDDVTGTGITFIPTPPGFSFGQSGKSVTTPVQSLTNFQTPVTSPTPATSTSNRWGFGRPAPVPTQPQGTTPTPRQTPGQSPTTETTFIPSTGFSITPFSTPSSSQKTSPLTAPFLGFEDLGVAVPSSPTAVEPKQNPFPGFGLAGFGSPMGKGKKGSKFVYGLKIHGVSNLLDIPTGESFSLKPRRGKKRTRS